MERTEPIKIPVCLLLLSVALDSDPHVLCCSVLQMHSYFCLLKQNACQPIAFKKKNKTFRLANACNWIQRVQSIICSRIIWPCSRRAELSRWMDAGSWHLLTACVCESSRTRLIYECREERRFLVRPSPESTLRCEGQARNRLSKIVKKKKKEKERVHGLIQGRCSCQGEKITLMHLLRLSLIVLMAIILSLIDTQVQILL